MGVQETMLFRWMGMGLASLDISAPDTAFSSHVQLLFHRHGLAEEEG